MIHDSFAPSSIIQLGWFGAPNHTKWMEKEKLALLLYELAGVNHSIGSTWYVSSAKR
jgi:hypothetical protein